KTRPYSKNIQTSHDNKPYQGTILEHLLLQNLVGHHNIGEHGFVRIEDADWNDGLDMAHQKGETIAFTHMYASNLELLANMISKLDIDEIEIFKDLSLLLEDKPNLVHFFDSVAHFSGKTIHLKKDHLVEVLKDLAAKRIAHLHEHAFKNERYQSYFNNDGEDSDSMNTMNLTGQTMALLSLTATPTQAGFIASKTRDLLFKEHLGGYQLNSNYNEVLTNMGRAYGFAYGHKENGAVFSHMAVMYAYGLYQYNLVSYGREAFMSLLKRAQSPDAKVFLGIPEYFNDRGIGMYTYLTGSASWMLKLIRTEVFGIQMDFGKLRLSPKLKKEDFINHKASITTYLFGKLTKVTYHNPKSLDFGFYRIQKIKVNGKEVQNELSKIDGDIEVILDEIL
ncbi:MAG: cellobiose phosphorylase, partial [Firmicutes bacterium]|nr:cellobiose phosphorylase [Bacillota bacterium]